jgi:hypothetical protein
MAGLVTKLKKFWEEKILKKPHPQRVGGRASKQPIKSKSPLLIKFQIL